MKPFIYTSINLSVCSTQTFMVWSLGKSVDKVTLSKCLLLQIAIRFQPHTHTHRLERSLIHKPFAFLFISIMRTNTICNLVSFSLSVYGRINPTQGKHRYNGRQILWWFLNERATQNRRTRNRVLCPMFGEHWSGRSDMFIRLQSSNNDHLPLQLYIVDNGAKYSMAQ